MKIPFLNSREHITLGTYGPPLLRRPVQLSLSEMLAHVWCIGKTGSGKSRWLAGLVLTLINRGHLIILLDPHGDLAELVLAHLVASGAYDQQAALEKIIYLDLRGAERRERYLKLNMLNQPYKDHTTARHVLEAFRRAWPELAQGAANFENILLASAYALINNQLPLPLLHDLLTNQDFREQLLEQTDDPQIVSFFRERFDRWGREQATMIESTQRRVFNLSFSPVLRWSLMQPENVLDFRAIRERGQSVLLNIGGLPEDEQKLVGCFATVFAEQAALSLADLPPGQRGKPTFLVMDEFSMFSATSEQSLSRILSLCRKYNLFLVMAHQSFSQTSERLQGALQNADISIAFKLGRPDAELAAPMFGKVNPIAIKHEVEDQAALGRTHPLFYSMAEQFESWTQAFAELPARHAFLRKPDGQVVQIRSLSVPDPVVDPKRLAEIKEHYLTTYFRPQQEIEEQAARYRQAHTPEPPKTQRFRLLDPEEGVS